jgi:hypothetical protein
VIKVPFRIIGAEAGTANLPNELRTPENSETKEMKIR